jgi:Stage II sporulation protein E (SpoIIE)
MPRHVLLVQPGATAGRLPIPVSVPLGVGGIPHQETTPPVPHYSTLVLYTDGLVEPRLRSRRPDQRPRIPGFTAVGRSSWTEARWWFGLEYEVISCGVATGYWGGKGIRNRVIMEESHSTRSATPSWDVPGSRASWAAAFQRGGRARPRQEAGTFPLHARDERCRNHLEADRAAHALSHDVDARDLECAEQRGRVSGHALVGKRPIDVPGMTWPCSSTAITSKFRASAGSRPEKQLSIMPNAPWSSTTGGPSPCRSQYISSAPTFNVAARAGNPEGRGAPASRLRPVVQVDDAVFV